VAFAAIRPTLCPGFGKTKALNNKEASMNVPRRVAIVGGNRIPFARANGAYATASNQDMLTAALEGLIERFNLHGLRLGEVAAGAVLKHSRDFNLTRECVLGSRLSPQTPAYDVQQACGTGLEAALLVANKIALGQIECGIAGGVDTTSDAPIGVNEDLRHILLQVNRSKTSAEKFKALLQLRPHNLSLSCRVMASRARDCPWGSTAN
jgi:acetyl-CoA C-acetyltransferase